MDLPTTKSKKGKPLTSCVGTLYGVPKIGKTTFMSGMEDLLFVGTENGHAFVEAYHRRVRNWDDVLVLLNKLVCTENQFKAVCIDTIDNFWMMCREYVFSRASDSKKKYIHESDFGYGKGYDLVKMEFERVLMLIIQRGYGLWMLSHSEKREIESYEGKGYTTLVPTLPKRPWGIVQPMSDFILFADIDRDENGRRVRVLRTKPDKNFVGADRSGWLPRSLPLDFAAFRKAYEDGIPQSDNEGGPKDLAATTAKPTGVMEQAFKLVRSDSITKVEDIDATTVHDFYTTHRTMASEYVDDKSVHDHFDFVEEIKPNECDTLEKRCKIIIEIYDAYELALAPQSSPSMTRNRAVAEMYGISAADARHGS